MAIIVVAGIAVVALFVLQRVDALNTSWYAIERVPLDAGAEPTGNTPSPEPERIKQIPTSDRSGPSGTGTTTTPSDPTTSTQPTPIPTVPPPSSSSVPTTKEATTTSVAESQSRTVSASEEPPSMIALIGSDSRSDLEETDDFGDFTGKRADVIMIAIRSGGDISLLSIPRDLYIPDICRRRQASNLERLRRL